MRVGPVSSNCLASLGELANGDTAAKLLALTGLLLSGCATVRPSGPPPRFEGLPPRVALAEPQIELWMDAGGKLSPEESAQAMKESRAALASALAGRGLDSEDPTAFLVVRELGLARTSGRRTGQVIAAVGIVVVVAAVVVAAVLGVKHAGGKQASGGHAAGAKPAPPRGHVAVPAPGHPIPGSLARLGPAGYRGYVPSPHVWFGVDFYMPIEEPAGPPAGATAEEGEEQPEDDLITGRDFFSGDRVELAFQLEDAHTGVVLWQYVTRDAIDPRDPDAMRRLVDAALGGQPFGRAVSGRAPPRPAQESQNP